MNKRLYSNRCFLLVQKILSVVLVISFVFGNLGSLFNMPVPKAEAAQVTIDATTDATGASFIHGAGQSVFISDQVGYKFYRDSALTCVYSKTTDGGATWGAAVTVDAQTDCIAIGVWYDRWTPSATGTFIHIATIDTSADDVFYNRLDTVNDSLLLGTAPVSVVTGSGQGGTFAALGNYPAITESTNKKIYIAMSDASDSYVVRCSATCQTNTNWTEVGTSPLALANDFNLLEPLANGNVMLINRSVAVEDIQSKIWDDTGGTWASTWTTIEGNATDNTTYPVDMAAVVSTTTAGNVYLAYVASNATLGTDDQIRTHRYTGGAWATTTSVLTGTARGLTGVTIGLDTINDDVYVAYTGRTTAATAATGNVYWKKSTNDMVTWNTETGPINTAASDMYAVDINTSSNERMYVSWHDNTADDIYGDTVANMTPGIVVTALGSQIATTSAPFTNKYIGGAFAITEMANARNITSITLSENGTIDAANAVKNVKLLYENDTTAPYDCASVSYGGSESQFGSTGTNGFSAADGTLVFSGSSVAISTTSAMCIYTVLDVNDTVTSGSKLNVYINNPSADIVMTNGGIMLPAASVDITGSTPVLNDNLTQIRYHWRNDNGTETTATSKTGGIEGVSFGGYQRTPVRLRMEVSNEGGTTSAAVQYRLEDSLATTTCVAATQWTDVGAAGGAWDMFNSANITDGNDTTNIAVANGGVTDDNPRFKTPNGALKDTSSQTGNITATSTQFIELEYSIVASSTTPDGANYCFRLTKAGTPLDTYSVYPAVTISADINVSATGTQSASVNAPATNQYLGGKFALVSDAPGTQNITSVKLTEKGTVDGQTGLSKIRLKYDLDTTAPYNCASESYAGTELQYGATSTAGFSSANGTTTFSGTLLASTTRSVCMYVVLDTTANASNGETIDVEITNATTDVTLASGSTAPASPTNINGVTTISAAILTQSRYHWRSYNGTQATSSSLTRGIENTPISDIDKSTPTRLRMEVSNEGPITSPNTAFRLEYGDKITTCANISSWTDVGAAGGAFDMYNSIHITDGANTTNIATSTGGLTDDNASFKTPNAAVKDTSSQVATTTLTNAEFIEAEFSIKETATAEFNNTYCFRLSDGGTALKTYSQYPELTTAPERDFFVQRGTANFSGLTQTLFAGVDYIAPAASTSAFVRITNIGYTGAGDSSAGGTQNAKDVTAYISNASNILNSFTITRPATAIATTTRVSWEIVEFIGTAGSDNEMKVRQQGSLTLTTTSLTATGTAVSSVVDDTDVVVFVTGELDPDTLTTDYNTGLFTSRWLPSTNQAVFQRGEASADASIVSYAVVEFTGINWKVQRTEHTYTAAGSTETNSITAVNSLARTFIHAQKRSGVGAQSTNQYGAEVWLSSIGAVSFLLETGSLLPTSQTSVAWIVENTQTSSGSMVVTRTNGNTTGGGNPLTLSVAIGATLSSMYNASIFGNARAALTTTVYPRPIAGLTIASTTHYQIWRSDAGAILTYRVEVVQWPTAGLRFVQKDYRLYTDNNALDPTDPWPAGVADLGENAALTATDEPMGNGEHIRIRQSLTAKNATMPALSTSFKLQYGERVTSCTAIADIDWFDVGSTTSSEIWRGYNATGTVDGTALSTDPPAGGALNLTLSDTAGTYEEDNNSALNPYLANEDSEVEYDWNIQQNGANAVTFYCFRMVDQSGAALSGYTNYPQMRTSTFTPKTQNWRFYSDVNNETPSSALASENTTPINIANGSTTKLRITVKETENISQNDTRFKLQYSEYSNFAIVHDVVATSSCTASSTWCYFNGGGSDNAVISTKVLSDADSCSGGVGNGCGTHNEGSFAAAGFTHAGNAATEYEFSLIAKAPRANDVYYFRLFDVVQGVAVPLNTAKSYPSVVIEGSSLVFSVVGLAAGTITEGVTLDGSSTPTSISFGTLPFNTDYEAGYRLNVNTNATEGYKVLMFADQQLLNSYGTAVPPVTGTNAVPTGWSIGCSGSAIGCFGYHAGDDLLQGGSARFGANDSYAKLSTSTAQEVMYSSIPINDTHDIVYKLRVSQTQPAGDYQTNVTYIATPVY